MKSQHHIEESQLDQMLGRHQERAHDHISFLVSPPCFATNFMRMEKFELASTADEAQGSTSRTVAGGKGAECRELPLGANAAGTDASGHRFTTPSLSNEHSAPDFSILSRAHIVKRKEERHVCHKCREDAFKQCSGCGKWLCVMHAYDTNGHRDADGMCSKCSKVPQDSTEFYGSNGRQV